VEPEQHHCLVCGYGQDIEGYDADYYDHDCSGLLEE
jgi:hypothetical protein